MGVYLRAKFEVSSIILTSFRQGESPPPPTQNAPLKIPPRSGLTQFQFKLHQPVCIKELNVVLLDNYFSNILIEVKI